MMLDGNEQVPPAAGAGRLPKTRVLADGKDVPQQDQVLAQLARDEPTSRRSPPAPRSQFVKYPDSNRVPGKAQGRLRSGRASILFFTVWWMWPMRRIKSGQYTDGFANPVPAR